MNGKQILLFSFVFLLVLSIIPNPAQTATLAYGSPQSLQPVQIDHTSDWMQNANGTLTPLTYSQNSSSVTINTKVASYFYNKSTCGFSLYNSSSTSGNPLIPFDNYLVLAELNGTTTWNKVNLINNAACSTSVFSNSTSVTISSIKQSSGNGVFQINYTKNGADPLKISFKAINQNPSWTNYHIGLQENLAVPRFVNLGNTTYDLSQFNGTTLNRSWIQNHLAQVIKLDRHLNYNMGIGWNHVNDITIHYVNNQASISIDYTYNTPILQPNQTILIDPSIDGSITTNTATSGSSIAITLTVGNNLNRALVVVVGMSNTASAAIDVSSITGAAHSFTNIGKAGATTGAANRDRSEIWISLNPSTGSNTITVNFDSTSRSTVLGIYSLYNVDQVTGFYSGNVQQNSDLGASNIVSTITPINIHSFLLDMSTMEDVFNGNSQTQTKAFFLSPTLNGASQYNTGPLGSLSPLTFGWTYTGGGGLNCQVIAEIKAFPYTPNAPTLLSVNQISSTSLNITWASSTGATWYFENRTSPAGGTLVNVVNTTSLFHLDTGLTPGTQYQYGIQGGNASGHGPVSNLLSRYTVNVAPTSLTLTQITSSSMRLGWTNPTGNFSGFKIEKESPVGGGWSTVISNTNNSTNRYDVTGLASNTQYNFRVSTNYATGTSDAGTSAPSSTKSGYTLPATPTSLTVTQSKSRMAHLAWADGGGNGTVKGYFIEYSIDGGSSFNTLIANTGNATTSYDYTLGTLYHNEKWRVSTIKYGGTSAPSNVYTRTIWQTYTVKAYQADAITTLYGSILQSNATSSNNQFTLVSGKTLINSTYGTQNMSAKSGLTNFIVYKKYNANTTSTNSLNMTTFDYTVDCPSTGTGPDVEVFTNETDGHNMQLPAPTCFANNTLKWHPFFTANGNTPYSYSSVVWVKIINATFLNNATLKANTTKITTLLSNPYIISNPITVGDGFHNIGLYLSMNLTVAPAFQPVNFTVGHISVTGTNHATAPITFSTTPINSTATSVTVTFPSTYVMSYDLGFNNEGKVKTYSGLPVTNPSLGISESTFTFKYPANDTVSIKAYDLVTKNNATYQLTQPNNQIPFVTQIKNFQNGAYGTKGLIGTIDIVTLIVLIIAMIGLNRVNETVGAVIMIMVIGGIAYFGIVSWPVTMTAAIALVLLIIVSSTKKLPWS